ncbi:aldo/keto reductase [Nibrella viscosa]|uniref:Aldo/keto reductase n=1 Tax=Nibrella viscosa TaxID=1084524 RepID=A0ABP8L3G8_9BACT
MQAAQSLAAMAGTITLGGDLTVNRMGYGAMRITGEGIWGPPRDRAECIRVLKRCLDLGINFIDTADSYGPHISEELIAEALHPYPDGLVIATKGGFERSGPNRWQMNGKPSHLEQALKGSLKRLKLDRIDLYQLHRFDPKVPADETLGFLKEQQQQGYIRHLGLSEVNMEQIQTAQRYFEVVSVQNLYNFANQKWNDVLIYCEENNIAFIPWYPLASGNLEAEQAIKAVVERHSKGGSTATDFQIALAWLLAASRVMLPIPGTSSVKHLEENTAATEISLTPEDLADMPLPAK